MEYRMTRSVQVAIRWMLMIVSGKAQQQIRSGGHIPNWQGFDESFFDKIIPVPIEPILPGAMEYWSPYNVERNVEFYYRHVHVATVVVLGYCSPGLKIVENGQWDFVEADYLTYLEGYQAHITSEWDNIKREVLPLMESKKKVIK